MSPFDRPDRSMYQPGTGSGFAESSRPDGAAVPRDSGFSLVEILVAIGLFMTVMVAVLPQLVVGIRGTALANQLGEARGVAQGRLETIRNLPYHVAPSAERRIDVLDTYFPNMTPSASAVTCLVDGRHTKPEEDWTGYVAPGATTGKRCPSGAAGGYEPAGGVAFYRKVDTVPRPSGGVYTLVTDTHFLGSPSVTASPAAYASVALTPPTGYNSATQGADKPPSSQIAVTLTVFYANRGALRLTRTYTHVSEVPRSTVRVEGTADATAFQLSSADGGDLSVSLGGGIVNLTGSLSSVSKVSATLAATSARQSTDAAVGSNVGPVVAPPQSVSTAVVDPGGSLPSGTSCVFACWGPTQIERFTANADAGLPVLTGDFNFPVEARGTDSAISFGKVTASQPDEYRAELKLDASQPLVSLAAGSPPVAASVCGASRVGSFTGRGFMRTTSTSVDTCAEAASSTLSLFPTTFAPAGVLRLTLISAAAQCSFTSSSSGTRVARSRYSVMIEHKVPVSAGEPTGYRSLTLTNDSSLSALPSDDAALQALRSQAVGDGKTLGDYVASWSSPTSAMAAPRRTTTGAEASLPGVIKLLSQPMRNSQPITATGNPSSAISLTLGSVGCYSSDVR